MTLTKPTQSQLIGRPVYALGLPHSPKASLHCCKCASVWLCSVLRATGEELPSSWMGTWSELKYQASQPVTRASLTKMLVVWRLLVLAPVPCRRDSLPKLTLWSPSVSKLTASRNSRRHRKLASCNKVFSQTVIKSFWQLAINQSAIATCRSGVSRNLKHPSRAGYKYKRGTHLQRSALDNCASTNGGCKRRALCVVSPVKTCLRERQTAVAEHVLSILSLQTDGMIAIRTWLCRPPDISRRGQG